MALLYPRAAQRHQRHRRHIHDRDYPHQVTLPAV
jgi:hypothetical protein